MEPLRPFIERVISDNKQIVALGLILYTDQHAHIKRVLRDTDYWDALDDMSGRKWTILSARAEVGMYRTPAPPPGVLAMMRRIWCEPVKNKGLLQSFGIDSTESLPLFVLFAPLKEGQVLQSKLRLDDSSEEAAYDRLRSVVSSLTEAVERIDLKNRGDYEAVFQAVNTAVFDLKVLDFIKSGFGFYEWVKDKLPS